MSLVEKQAECAREALLRKKPDSALEYAMFVLATEPDHAGMLALVAECVVSAEAPRARPKLRLPSDCLWHAHHGEHTAAVVALLHVVEEFPDRDWLHWAVPWLEQIPDDSLPVNEALHYLALLIRRFPKVVRQRETERAVLRRAFPLLDALEPRLPRNTNFFVFASEVARKAADGSRALRYAEHALSLSQTYDPLLTSATCRRLLGRTDEAVTFLQRAIELDASSRAELEADIGQVLYEGERYAEALRHWERCDPLRNDLILHFVRWRAREAQGDQAWADWFESVPADLSIDEANAVLREPHVGGLVEPTAISNVNRIGARASDNFYVQSLFACADRLRFALIHPAQARGFVVTGDAVRDHFHLRALLEPALFAPGYLFEPELRGDASARLRYFYGFAWQNWPLTLVSEAGVVSGWQSPSELMLTSDELSVLLVAPTFESRKSPTASSYILHDAHRPEVRLERELRRGEVDDLLLRCRAPAVA